MPLPILLQSLALPVIASPMFTVSYPELVIAQCCAGIVGAFPALNARSTTILDEWLIRIKADLKTHGLANPNKVLGPLAVNQIMHPSNVRLEQDIAVCLEHQVPIFITSLQAPTQDMIDAVHAYGGIVLHDVTNLRHAHKAIDKGVDGLIVVAAGAGGHGGVLSPFALIAEVRRFFKGPIALAGAIASGRAILAAQAMGADLAYIGTRFIATQEAQASARYKEAIIAAHAADIVYTDFFTGIHGNYLRDSIVQAGLDPNNLSRAPDAQIAKLEDLPKVKAWKDILGAGQGVGSIEDCPKVAELIDRFKSEYSAARIDLLDIH